MRGGGAQDGAGESRHSMGGGVQSELIVELVMLSVKSGLACERV